MTSRREILDLAEREGWAVEPTRGGHLKLTHPKAEGYVITSSTPGDHRVLENLRAALHRAIGRALKPEAPPSPKSKPRPRPNPEPVPVPTLHGRAREVEARRIEGQAGPIKVELRLADEGDDAGRVWRITLASRALPT